MMPLLPFITGMIAGAAAVAALRDERTRAALDDTGTRLRNTASEAEQAVRAAARSGFDLLRCVAPGAARPAHDAAVEAVNVEAGTTESAAARAPESAPESVPESAPEPPPRASTPARSRQRRAETQPDAEAAAKPARAHRRAKTGADDA